MLEESYEDENNYGESEEDTDFDNEADEWFSGEGKGANLDDIDSESNQKQINEVDSERVNVNRKLRNFFGM